MRDERGEGSSVDVASLVEWLAAKTDKLHGTHLATDATALGRLREAALKAVRDLEDRPEVHIAVPYIGANAAGPVHVEEVMTRTALKNLFAPTPHHEPPPPPAPPPTGDESADPRAAERKRNQIIALVCLVAIAFSAVMLVAAYSEHGRRHDDRGKREGH